jgi:chromosome segregation ATPase
MGPKKKKSESRSSGARRGPTAKSPRTCKSAGMAPRRASTNDEEAFQDVMTIVTDVQRQLEHHMELDGALQEEMAAVRTGRQEAETLVTTRTQQIERVQEELSSVQAENERLMVELSSSEEERSEAAKVINTQKHALEDRKRKIQSLKEKLSSLEKTLEVTAREAESREHDSRETTRRLQQDVEELETRLKQTTQELSRANALTDDLSRKNEQLESRVAHLERTRTNLGRIHDALKGVRDQMLNHETKR